MNEILIYIPKETNRVRYVFRLVFSDLLKISFKLTTDLDKFQSADQPKMMYGNKAHTDDLFFKTSGLLFERGVKPVDINVLNFNGNAAFFPVYDEDSVLPFDIFSSIFYLISRYEEYLPFVKDQHGRFSAHLSVSTKHSILQKPMVNIWALEVKRIIHERYPDFIFPEKKFRFIATYDIDSAWAFAQKGFFRIMGGYYLAIRRWDFRDIIFRTKVLLNKENDPYDTFELQMEYQKKYNLRPIYFILFGQYTRFDKNISIHNRKFKKLVKWIADYAQVGIHPSYYSTEFPDLVKKEKSALEELLKTDIKLSRQHFLKLSLPDTYQNLIENDILEDYTMGYALLPGFRAGICDTYKFYDLDLEVETKLRIHPFAVMDGTLKDYMHLGPTEAIERIRQLMNEVKKVNGTFISLWHNESLSNKMRWKGWRRVYEQMLEMASDANPR
ncbi:MAG: polysaccharide deacetylase family protein [Bacteroidales bacterium]|nr:polysaccharide deacetylase family protein [Bacteroidales bacterium]